MTTSASWNDYLELCKPKVVLLMLVTAIVGMLLASPFGVSWQILLFGTVGIALSAGAGGVLNQLVDQRFDAIMSRTQSRPIPSGKISTRNATIFAIVLACVGLATLIIFVNTLTAILTLATLVGYALIYTVFLKHATPQNIVIGGLAGAAPPLLGWTAVSGQFDYLALLPVMIIFTWTPPHFWALAISRYEEYKDANIPMLPLTHGIEYTKLNILLYTFLMVGVSLLPFIVDMSGVIYLVGAVILGAIFIYWAIRLKLSNDPAIAYKTFNYSLYYLALLFAFLLIDHFIPILT